MIRAVLFLSLLSLSAAAQTDAVWQQLSAAQTEMSVYTKSPPDPGRKTVYLETPFGKAEFIHPEQAAALKGTVIEKVELVYTRFASNENFNQPNLNQTRIRNLKQELPDAFGSELTEWTAIAQTGAADVTTARAYFHGFAVTYRPTPSKEFIEGEIDTMLVNLKREGIPTDEPTTTPRFSDRISGETLDADYDTFNLAAKKSSLPYRIISREKTIKGMLVMYNDTIWLRPKGAISESPLVDRPKLRDTAVTAVFWRNMSRWEHSVIVCDLTASMSPYSTQLLSWLYETAGKSGVEGFVFFNDGNGKEDNRKKIGNTGGLYTQQNADYVTVMKTVTETMHAGNGGDVPENDVEAMIHAADKFDGDHQWILIADNVATPRDMELVSKFKHPIHVVLCGARYRVNPNYLDLAWKTGGSVHTVDQDVDLAPIREGQTVVIGKFTWKLENGHFSVVSDIVKNVEAGN